MWLQQCGQGKVGPLQLGSSESNQRFPSCHTCPVSLQMQEKAKDIYMTFLSSKASTQVNVEGQSRLNEKILEEPHPLMFQKLQDQVPRGPQLPFTRPSWGEPCELWHHTPQIPHTHTQKMGGLPYLRGPCLVREIGWDAGTWMHQSLFFMPQDLGCLSLTEKGGRTEEPTVQEGGCGDCCEEG